MITPIHIEMMKYCRICIVAACTAALLCLAGCMDKAESQVAQDTGINETEEESTQVIVVKDDSEPVVGAADPVSKDLVTDADEKTANREAGEENEAEETAGQEDPYDSTLADKHVRITLNDEGYDVFAPRNDGKQDYRYSPSIMLDKDGGIDAWFASPGDGHDEYDWITYIHSDDGGATWSDEKVVLAPTPNTADLLSICDPDVFYYDGYYYMGYTSTVDRKEKGLCNSLFLARSQNPDGPYEKWNGSGWGGMPVPIVYFNGIELGWGCGEPAFVVLDDTVYVYSTRDGYSGVPDRVRVTEVRTADLTDPMWPRNLSLKGHAGVRNDLSDDKNYVYDDADSWDVVYLEESHKFVALCTNRRFKQDSCLLYYESDDGISFERVSEINTNVIAGCHNSGMMADGRGHIGKDTPIIIGYAYSGSGNSKWGIWSTRFVSASIDYTDEIDRSEDGKENLKIPIEYKVPMTPGAPLMLRTDQLVYQVTADNKAIEISYRIRDNYRNERSIDKSEIKIEKYDPEILMLTDDNSLIPIAEGMSIVGIEYRGIRRDIFVCVLPDKVKAAGLKYFYPVCESYELKVREPIVIKVRPMAVFNNYDIHELSNTEILSYGVTFSSSDRSVCTVSGDGTLTIHSPGDATVTASSGSGIKYSINIHVKEDN